MLQWSLGTGMGVDAFGNGGCSGMHQNAAIASVKWTACFVNMECLQYAVQQFAMIHAGVPLFWVLSSSEDASATETWMKSLKDWDAFPTPSCWITDACPALARAYKSVV